MDRTERLLDLVALLLDADAPVPLERLREVFPDYAERGGSAAERKFERDKAELAELGLPLRFVPSRGDTVGGYLIDRASYYLPAMDLRAEEWAMISTAAGAALARGDFPGRDLAHALRKICFARGGTGLAPVSDALAFTGTDRPRLEARRGHLEQLWIALQYRKRLQFTYRNGAGTPSVRRLDCYGVAFRRGQWIAVGHDDLRGALRTFRVDRMQQVKVNRSLPRSPDFAVPADFDIGAHLNQQAWDLPLHPPEEANVELDASLAPLAARLFPGARSEPGGRRLTLTVRNRDALVRQVLAQSPRAWISGPPALRARARQLLSALRSSLVGAPRPRRRR